MKNVLATYRELLVRKEKRFLRRWEATRAKGKAQFIGRNFFIWMAMMFLCFALPEYYFDRDARRFLLWLLLISIFGLVASFTLWWTNEGKYRSAKIDARIKSSFW